jgi:hypothetical protein
MQKYEELGAVQRIFRRQNDSRVHTVLRGETQRKNHTEEAVTALHDIN